MRIPGSSVRPGGIFGIIWFVFSSLAYLSLIAAIASLAGALNAATPDTYLPWEGGSAHYRRWPNGPRPDAEFFPISVWLQNPARALEYKTMGVNQFVGLWKGPTGEQLQALAAAGMRVLAAYREGILDSPDAALIRGWTMMDEPDNAQPKAGGGYGPCVFPEAIAEQYRKLKTVDASRPVFLNLGQGVINDAYKGRGSECARRLDHYPAYIRAADIVSYDVYPVNGNYPLWWVGAGIDRLRKWAQYEKPIWNWIETTAIRGGTKPSPDQIKAQVWMSIIHGSMGVGYFCHQFKPALDESAALHDAETRRALTAINKQVAALASVLNSPPVGNGVAVSSSNPDVPIETMLKRYGGSTYLFAMGARPGGETTATFTIRDCGDRTLTVLGEEHTIQVAAGVFRDRFTGYEVHLYKIPFDPGGR